MPSNVVLIVQTASRRYAVRNDDLLGIRSLTAIDLAGSDKQGHAYFGVELGPFLDPNDLGARARWQALIIPMRRRYVALLIHAVETFLEHPHVEPLPELLRRHLQQPWATGAIVQESELIVQIDLRAVARSALITRPG